MDYKLCKTELFDVVGQSVVCQFFDSETNVVLPHTHSFYELFLVDKGNPIHKCNEDSQQLSPGDCVLIRPDDKHYFKSSDRFTIYNIMFTREFADEVFHFIKNEEVLDKLLKSDFPVVMKLSLGEQNDFKNEFNKINVENFTNKNIGELAFRKFIISIFSLLISNYYKDLNLQPSWFEETLVKINLFENFTKGAQRFIELSGKSSRQLNRVLMKSLGVTITEYINLLRLDYIAKALITSQKPVFDVILDAGYTNISHAYRLFSKKFGCTPKQYRKSKSAF